MAFLNKLSKKIFILFITRGQLNMNLVGFKALSKQLIVGLKVFTWKVPLGFRINIYNSFRIFYVKKDDG